MLVDHLNKMEEQSEILQVPEFDSGLAWMNASPLYFRESLKGKIVVLHFWTSCCINSMHTVEDVQLLKQKYKDAPIVCLGVYSPKYPEEKSDDHFMQAVQRLGICYPVVNDKEHKLWDALGIRSWPTFVIVGPKGNLLFSESGEGHLETLDHYIAATLAYYQPDEFSFTPILEREESFCDDVLAFPSKLAVDLNGKRLFISDTQHNRIIATDFEGNVLQTIGTGNPGFSDGELSQACFNKPVGIAYLQQHLIVADTNNHALRSIDLATSQVTTIAGSGKQGRDYKGGAFGSEQLLNSPWDVCVSPSGDKVYIAMAGLHQIWVHEFSTGRTRNLSGSGVEHHQNSNHLLHAAWAQPSGLVYGLEHLYIADSESSTIRAIDLSDSSTTSLAGGGTEQNPLFAFGDQEGQGEEAKLQHPHGICWMGSNNKLLIADTYNHRIKLLDDKTQTVNFVAGSGIPGLRDGPFSMAQFRCPSGIVYVEQHNLAFVADNHNHCVRVLDFNTKEVSTLQVKGC